VNESIEPLARKGDFGEGDPDTGEEAAEEAENWVGAQQDCEALL
jgi:hypothetical protein